MSRRFVNIQLVLGLVLLSVQFVLIGGAQLGQMWAVALMPFLVMKKATRVRGHEILAYLPFIGVALLLTALSGYPRIKAAEQIAKFVVVYPVFYLVGRALGRHYLRHKLPYGYIALFMFLAYQVALQKLNVPILYKTVDFMQDALHGSFKEKNWLATFFFLCSYALFLQSRRGKADVLWFIALSGVVALLSESKTELIPCGIVLMTQIRGRTALKIVAIAGGAALYYFRFHSALSSDQLSVRLEQERGLAFVMSVALVIKDWTGYGFGFVESYFASSPVSVIGLGAGTNSIFCSPLDLMLIAGVPGVIAWLVFFCGVGQGWRTILCLAPVAAWSLVNPMHQSEMVYLFCGYLVSWSSGVVVPRETAMFTDASYLFPQAAGSRRFRGGRA